MSPEIFGFTVLTLLAGGALDLLAAFAMAFGPIGEVVADFVLTPIPTFLGLAALTLLYSRLACEGPLR